MPKFGILDPLFPGIDSDFDAFPFFLIEGSKSVIELGKGEFVSDEFLDGKFPGIDNLGPFIHCWLSRA
jgi:hypothetical protein